MKNILKQRRRIVGAVFFIIFLSIIGTTIVRADNDWDIVLDNENWSTSPGEYTGWSWEIYKPVTFKMVLVTDIDIHLYVFNAAEYTKWSNGSYAEGYIWKDNVVALKYLIDAAIELKIPIIGEPPKNSVNDMSLLKQLKLV